MRKWYACALVGLAFAACSKARGMDGVWGGHQEVRRVSISGLDSPGAILPVRVEITGDKLRLEASLTTGKPNWACEGIATRQGATLTVAQPHCTYWNGCYPNAKPGLLTAVAGEKDLTVSLSIDHGAGRGACVANNEPDFVRSTLHAKLTRGEPGAPPAGP